MPTRDTSALAGQLMVSCSRFTRLVRRTAPEGTHATWRTLSVLAEHGELRITALARIDQLSQPSATALVARLESDGLVQRIPDPADGRATLIRLTGAGHRTLAELRKHGTAQLAPRLALLNAADRAVLARAAELLDDLTHTPPTETGSTT